jgi:hypothetical protein
LPTDNGNRKLETGNWRLTDLEDGNWKMENGNWKLTENGNRKPETGELSWPNF